MDSSIKSVARIWVRMTLAAVVVLLVSSAGFAQLKVATGDVKDTRRTDGIFNKLEIDLKLSGESLAAAKGLRVLISKAVDETGKNLIDETQSGKGFKELSLSDKEAKMGIELKNPERRAMSVQEISGSVEIFSPQTDPKSVIQIPSFQKNIGKPIPSTALKAANIEVIIWTKEIFEARKKAEEERLNKELEKVKKIEQSKNPLEIMELLGEGLAKAFGSMFSSFAEMGENDIAFNVKDPGSKLINIDVEDDKGKPIARNGRTTIGGDPRIMIYAFKEKLPATARIRLYVLTPKAVLKVPFKLTNVPLP